MSELTPEDVTEALRSEWGPTAAPTSVEADHGRLHARLAEKPWLEQPLPPAEGHRGLRVFGTTLAAIGFCAIGFVALHDHVSRDEIATTGSASFRTSASAGASMKPTKVDAVPSGAIAPSIQPPEQSIQSPEPSVQLPAPSIQSPEPSVQLPAPSIAITALPDAPPAARRRAPASEADSDTLAAELELVHAAQNALRDGAPDRALEPLATHARRFPRGILREERMTLQVLAHCARGDIADARAIRATLEKTSPESSHLKRLSTSCAQ